MTDPLTGYTLTPADYIERGLAMGPHAVTPAINPDDFRDYYAHDYARRYARLSADKARRQAVAPDPVQEEQRLLREDYEARLASDSPENAVIRYLGNEFDAVHDSLDAAVARGDTDEVKRISDGIRQFTADNRQEISRWRRQEMLDLRDPMAARLYNNADALLTESWLSVPRELRNASQQVRGGVQQAPMTARQILDQDTPEAVRSAVKTAAQKYDLLDDRQAAMVADRGNVLFPVFRPFVETYDTTEEVIAKGNVDNRLLKARDDARSVINTYTKFATRFDANEEGLGDFIRGAYSTFAADVTSDQLSKWYDLYRSRADGVSADTWFTNVKSAIASAVPGTVESVRDENGTVRRNVVPAKNFDPRSLMPIALSAMEKLRDSAGGAPDPSQLAPALRTVAGQVAALQNVMDRDLASLGFASAASDAVVARLSGDPEATVLDRMWVNAGRFAGAMGAALADDGSVVSASGGTIADPLLTPMFVQAMTRGSVDANFDPVDHLSRKLASLSGMRTDEVRPVVERAIPLVRQAAETGMGPTVQEVLSQLSGFAAKQGSNPNIPERPRENYPQVNPATGAPIDNSGDFVPPAAGAPNASSMDAELRRLARDMSPAAPATGTDYYADFIRRANAGRIAAEPSLKNAAVTLAKEVGNEIGRQELGKSEHERNVIKNTPAMNKAAGEALLYIMEQPEGDGLGLTGLHEVVKDYIRSGKALALLGTRQKDVHAYEAGAPLNAMALALRTAVDDGTAKTDPTFPRRATMFFHLLYRTCQEAPAGIPGDPRASFFLSWHAGTFASRYAPTRLDGGAGYVLTAFKSPAFAEQALRNLLQQQGFRVTPNPRGDKYSIFEDPKYNPFLAAGISLPGKFGSSDKDKDSGESRKGLDYSGLVWNLDITLFGKPKTVVEASPVDLTSSVDPMSVEAAAREEAYIRQAYEESYGEEATSRRVQQSASKLISRLCFGDTALQAAMAPVMASYLRQFPNKETAMQMYSSLLPLAREKFVHGGYNALRDFANREAASETVFFTRPIVDPNNPQAVIDVPDFRRVQSWADRERLADELSRNNPRGRITAGELIKRSPEAARLWQTYYMARQRKAGSESGESPND